MPAAPAQSQGLLSGTVFLGAGIIDKIPENNVEIFAPLLKLTTATAAFNIGCEVAFTKVRRIAKRKTS